jgi:hypothetical protein
MYKLFFLFKFFIFSFCYSNDLWIGEWIATDQWQSEFFITVNEDGTAKTNYGNGDVGTWIIKDGTIEIKWESGKTDYLFSGVMGFQRISKNKDRSYTSGLRKLLD